MAENIFKYMLLAIGTTIAIGSVATVVVIGDGNTIHQRPHDGGRGSQPSPLVSPGSSEQSSVLRAPESQTVLGVEGNSTIPNANDLNSLNANEPPNKIIITQPVKVR